MLGVVFGGDKYQHLLPAVRLDELAQCTGSLVGIDMDGALQDIGLIAVNVRQRDAGGVAQL